MSGTFFGLGLSQRVKSSGKPESGWRLYSYEAGTSNPVTTYSNPGLTVGSEQPWPLVADASGTLPALWVPDGSYRVRGVSSSGSTIFYDLPSVLALGASSGGGGGGDTTDPNALLQTGDPIWRLKTGTMTGFVRMNGRTLGSATSGATEHANADAENLFLYLWNNLLDSICPVTGGRGISAAADWAANKNIGIPYMQDTAAFGLDDMGNVAFGGLAGITFGTGDAVTVGSRGGGATITLTQANLPAATLTTTITDPGHTHNTDAVGATALAAGAINTPQDGGGTAGGIVQTATTGITASTALGGSGTAFDKMPYFRLGTWYCKL